MTEVLGTQKSVELVKRTKYTRPVFWADIKEKFGIPKDSRVICVTSDGQEHLLDIDCRMYIISVVEEKMDNKPNFGPGVGGNNAG